ncbi:MAG TPA: hypothetical protein VGV38_02170, partial [Pyrinomonadaceae bacterium]|nr:hypothetical protein [Pyrinomonadaceae bacterium]
MGELEGPGVKSSREAPRPCRRGPRLQRRAPALLLLACALLFQPAGILSRPLPDAQGVASPARLSARDEEFLEDLSRRAFRFFVEQSDPETGLVLDRARTDGSRYPPGTHHHNVASSAATGFGLTALCVGAERDWMPRREARERARRTLRFLSERAPHVRGWFLHWMDASTGERRWKSEYSSIDTALLLAGVLTVRRCFPEDREVGRLATH